MYSVDACLCLSGGIFCHALDKRHRLLHTILKRRAEPIPFKHSKLRAMPRIARFVVAKHARELKCTRNSLCHKLLVRILGTRDERAPLRRLAAHVHLPVSRYESDGSKSGWRVSAGVSTSVYPRSSKNPRTA